MCGHSPANRDTSFVPRAIGGVSVCCLTPEYQIISHAGYTLQDKDFKDAIALSEKFNIVLPKEYL